MDRYQRQIVLKQLGGENQSKIAQASILIVGVGGLGCPALLYLAAAGVGHLGIVDHDVVELSNLHRQILFTTEDIGKAKVMVAKEKIKALNPEVNIKIYHEKITAANALAMIGEYDLVIDATDQLESRYMINDACVLLGRPLVYGAIAAFEGQLALFNDTRNKAYRSANLRDVFPDINTSGRIYNCAEDGVIGVLPGIIGTMQATEAIKWITGLGQTMTNQLMSYDALSHRTYIVSLTLNQKAFDTIPKDEQSFATLHTNANECSTALIHAVHADEVKSIWENKNVVIIDVREWGEQPTPQGDFSQIPLSIFDDHPELQPHDQVLFFCQSGIRSKQAAASYAEKFQSSNIFYIADPIQQWIQYTMA